MDYTYLSDTVKIKKIEEDDYSGSFEIEGLFRGYGLTIGNALRRTLLSSLPGAAVTKFAIKGVGHEFRTIPGVVEDVIEIGLNLKNVRFIFNADGPQELSLKVKGEKEVTAADIKGDALVEVKNPDAHIATITDKSTELDMVITVEKGLGYVPVESQKTDRLPVGTVAVDAIFSPVLNVNFKIDNMRVGDRTDYNKIYMEIETDGTVSPSSALHKAANILIDHLNKVVAIDVKESATEKKAAKSEKKK